MNDTITRAEAELLRRIFTNAPLRNLRPGQQAEPYAARMAEDALQLAQLMRSRGDGWRIQCEKCGHTPAPRETIEGALAALNDHERADHSVVIPCWSCTAIASGLSAREAAEALAHHRRAEHGQPEEGEPGDEVKALLLYVDEAIYEATTERPLLGWSPFAVTDAGRALADVLTEAMYE